MKTGPKPTYTRDGLMQHCLDVAATVGYNRMTDPRSIAALDVAEGFANGEATREELKAAGAAADAAWAASLAAARAAADAAKDAQKEMFIAMCEGKAPWQVK